MEISGGSGRFDCNGWRLLNQVWNIFPYLLLVFLLIPGGICSCLATAWSHRGAFSALFACALHRSYLHPLTPASLPTLCPFVLRCLGCLSQLLKRVVRVWERPAKAEHCKSLAACHGSQTVDQILSSLGSAVSLHVPISWEDWKIFFLFENK